MQGTKTMIDPKWTKGAIAMIASCAATVVGISAAWPLVEPFVAAHRGYVREYSTARYNTVNAGLIEVQISIARSRQSAIRDRLLTEEIALTRVAEGEEKIRKQHQIKELQEEFIRSVEEIKHLQRVREKEM